MGDLRGIRLLTSEKESCRKPLTPMAGADRMGNVALIRAMQPIMWTLAFS